MWKAIGSGMYILKVQRGEAEEGAKERRERERERERGSEIKKKTNEAPGHSKGFDI